MSHLIYTSEFNLFMNNYESYYIEFKRGIENTTESDQCDEYDFFYEYIQFFKNSKKKKFVAKNSKACDSTLTRLPINQTDVFQFKNYLLNPSHDYPSWIKTLIKSLIHSDLINNEMLITCSGLFENNLALCEQVFPYLLRTILLSNTNMGKLIGTAFRDVFDMDYVSLEKNSKNAELKRYVKLFIGTIDFLRIHSKKTK